MPKIGSYFPYPIWKKNFISFLLIKSGKALVNSNQTRSLTLAQSSLFLYFLYYTTLKTILWIGVGFCLLSSTCILWYWIGFALLFFLLTLSFCILAFPDWFIAPLLSILSQLLCIFVPFFSILIFCILCPRGAKNSSSRTLFLCTGWNSLECFSRNLSAFLLAIYICLRGSSPMRPWSKTTFVHGSFHQSEDC